MSREPLNRYLHLVETGDYLPDPAQRQTMETLNSLWRELDERPRNTGLKRLLGRHAGAPKGIYLWGGVGRGKTWMMDLFFEALPTGHKQRIHFHRFMARVHAELRNRASSTDPLADIARQWAREVRVLCFDEFFVSDIADAMLLAGLLRGLFEQGVVLVATSNIPPGDLYRDGLQRARFLPAIELIHEHMQVVHVGGDQDHRLRLLERSEIFHVPLDAAADRSLRDSFERMQGDCELAPTIQINGRQFNARRRADGIIWFEFAELCEQPRGSADYVEIARAFNTVLLSDVPVMDDDNSDAARRFVALVDEFYDRNVKLLMSAAAPVNGLYTGTRLEFIFDRTRSRLTEMQSHDYLAKPHLP